MNQVASRACGALLLLILIVGAVAGSTGCLGGREVCSQCGRQECANLAFSISLQDGRQVNTCCPRCGLHYLATERKDAPIASLHVRDFETAKTLDATTAVYVSGSDVHPCLGVNSEPPRDERGPIAAAYDRCEPSLIAFGGMDPALRFVAVHGGTITDWEEVSKGIDSHAHTDGHAVANPDMKPAGQPPDGA